MQVADEAEHELVGGVDEGEGDRELNVVFVSLHSEQELHWVLAFLDLTEAQGFVCHVLSEECPLKHTHEPHAYV